jgi:hypothetical protein
MVSTHIVMCTWGVQVFYNTEEFCWYVHSMSISCLVTMCSMVCADYYARWSLLNFDMVQCMGRNSCGVSVHDTKTVRCGYWCTTQKQCTQVINVMEKKCIVDIGVQKSGLP